MSSSHAADWQESAVRAWKILPTSPRTAAADRPSSSASAAAVPGTQTRSPSPGKNGRAETEEEEEEGEEGGERRWSTTSPRKSADVGCWTDEKTLAVAEGAQRSDASAGAGRCGSNATVRGQQEDK